MSADRAALEKIAGIVLPAGATYAHLGTGGFASTFKVTTSEGEVYALKVVDAAQSGSERTDRELAALQRVNHPNVVGYLDTGVVQSDGLDYRWLKMSFVCGSTLAAVLGGGRRYDLAAAVGLIRQAVAGAAALWAEQTAHRDLTPNNILVTESEELVIVDLGLARALDDETITTLPTPGTPGWMSPEQVGANPTHGDWRSDQFVLGLMAYWLLTGSKPFSYRTAYEAWMAPDQQDPRNPREINSAIPTALSELVMKMLARQPHRRYLQPGTLAADLERVAASLAIPEATIDVAPRFFLSLGQTKNFVETPGFLAGLGADGILIEPRGANRVSDLLELTGNLACERMVDPCTYLSRSPEEHRPGYFRDQLPRGQAPVLTGFPTTVDRTEYCRQVLDYQLGYGPSLVLAPYFYAGSGETFWIHESLRCAAITAELLEELAPSRQGLIEPVWTTVAIAASWLANDDARDELMTSLTSQPVSTLNLLIHTTQPSFGPLSDRAVLRGLSDVLTVMREAGVAVILGRRASEGLLGLSLGAAGWTTGVSGVQMNMAPHPETTERGGPGYDRIYVPQLLTHVTTQTFVQFASAEPSVMKLQTVPGRQLIAENSTFDVLSTEQRILLRQHNIEAARTQVTDMATVGPTNRLAHMRRLVVGAQDIFRQLPAPGVPGESALFLDSWKDVLS